MWRFVLYCLVEVSLYTRGRALLYKLITSLAQLGRAFLCVWKWGLFDITLGTQRNISTLESPDMKL